MTTEKKGNYFSYHCLIRYSVVAAAIFYLIFWGWSWWAIIIPILIEGLIEVLHQRGICLDPVINKTKNIYRWYNIFVPASMGKNADYTEGKYDNNPNKSFDQAQLDQRKWILDQIGCKEGVRILDIGCGNCNLLLDIKKRNGIGTGLTISQEEYLAAKEKDLDVHLINYKNLDESWYHRFDAVVCNGSLEHFVDMHAGFRGEASQTYQNFFSICSKLLDPNSSIRKVVITAIHVRREKWRYLDYFHLYLLERSYGGWYPQTKDHLVTCAAPHFNCELQLDATRDYDLTSQEWWRRLYKNWNVEKVKRIFTKMPAMLFSDPYLIHKFLHLFFRSWPWQFSGKNPPMIHYWLVFKK